MEPSGEETKVCVPAMRYEREPEDPAPGPRVGPAYDAQWQRLYLEVLFAGAFLTSPISSPLTARGTRHAGSESPSDHHVCAVTNVQSASLLCLWE